jgi:hypothetical protein
MGIRASSANATGFMRLAITKKEPEIQVNSLGADAFFSYKFEKFLLGTHPD